MENSMETRVQPELVLRRKVCMSCGEGTFEFAPDNPALQNYICIDCS